MQNAHIYTETCDVRGGEMIDACPPPPIPSSTFFHRFPILHSTTYEDDITFFLTAPMIMSYPAREIL